MLKIEEQMIEAIRKGWDWHSRNTEVEQIGWPTQVTSPLGLFTATMRSPARSGAIVRLHDRTIARVHRAAVSFTIPVDDDGTVWDTRTTRSRLRALLDAFTWTGLCTYKGHTFYYAPDVGERRLTAGEFVTVRRVA